MPKEQIIRRAEYGYTDINDGFSGYWEKDGPWPAGRELLTEIVAHHQKRRHSLQVYYSSFDVGTLRVSVSYPWKQQDDGTKVRADAFIPENKRDLFEAAVDSALVEFGVHKLVRSLAVRFGGRPVTEAVITAVENFVWLHEYEQMVKRDEFWRVLAQHFHLLPFCSFENRI